jgi:hypothetical protein
VVAASLMYEVICAKSEKYCSSRGSSLANICGLLGNFYRDSRKLDSHSKSGNING